MEKLSPKTLEMLARLVFERLKAEGFLENCTTCSHWNVEQEICNKFNARPPAKVIVTGCQFHDLIPF